MLWRESDGKCQLRKEITIIYLNYSQGKNERFGGEEFERKLWMEIWRT